MKRRSYLATLTGVVSILSAGKIINQSNTEENREYLMKLTNVSTEYNGDFPVHFDAKIRNGEYTEENPAIITVIVESSDSRGFQLISGNQVPISVPAYSDSENPGTVLVESGNKGSDDDWILSPGDSESLSNLNVSTQRVSEENPISQNLELWGDSNFVDKITQGSYSFSHSIGVTRDLGKTTSKKESVLDQNWILNCELETIN